jgi:hypothetical protein
MEHTPVINKWKQLLDEMNVQREHLVIMDNEDEMLFQCLEQKRSLVEQLINDLKNI